MAIRVSDAQLRAIAPPPAVAVPLQVQARDQWCWAACCSMALVQQGHPKQQCVIAGSYLSGKCCQAGACNSPCLIADVQAVFRNNGLHQAAFVNGTLAAAALAGQLPGQGPGAGNTVALGLEGSTDHMVLVVGASGSSFIVNDPDPTRGTCALTYAELLQDANRARSWSVTWQNLRS